MYFRSRRPVLELIVIIFSGKRLVPIKKGTVTLLRRRPVCGSWRRVLTEPTDTAYKIIPCIPLSIPRVFEFGLNISLGYGENKM